MSAHRHRRWVIATAPTREAAEAAVAEFFDGDTIADTHTKREWTGVPQESTSVETFLTGPTTVTVTRDPGTGPEPLLVGHPWDGGTPLAFIDPTPTLNGLNEYTAVGSTVYLESAEATATLVTHGDRQAYLNAGPGMADLLPMRGAVTVTTTPHRVAEVIDLGDRAPVTLYGDSESLAVSVQVDELEADRARVEGIEAFIRKAGPVCYRDPSGRRVIGRITGGVSGWHGRTARLAFTVEEST